MTKQSITRRDLLKATLAAGGGITAAAFLPEKWVKPVVESGVLPVHAQASGTGSISGNAAGGQGVETINVYAAGTIPVTMKTGFKVAKPKPVKLLLGGVILYTATTDTDDNYNIPNVTPGTYDVECSKFNHTEHDVVVTVGNNTVVNFSLG
jgi:hypothetical protein